MASVRKSTLTQGSDGICNQTQSTPQDNETAIHKYFNGNKTDLPETATNLELPNIFSTSGVLNSNSSFKHHKNSPLISPSSIPYPNPSTSTKQSESSYPTYGGYLYSIPGYSAFQPIQYPISLIGQNSGESAPIVSLSQPPLSKDIIQLTTCSIKDAKTDISEDYNELNTKILGDNDTHTKISGNDFTTFVTSQQDPKSSLEYKSTSNVKHNEDTSSPGSGNRAAKEKCIDDNQAGHKIKHKPTERFSLKTSIPISKIDMKCVNNATELQHFNFSPFRDLTETKQALPNITNTKDALQKVKIQSNILIKSGSNSDSDTKTCTPNIQNNLSGMNNFPQITNEGNDMNFWQDSSKDENFKDKVSETIPLIASQGKIIIGGTLPRMQKTLLPTKHGPESSSLSKTILQTSLERKDQDQQNKLVFLPNRSAGSQQLMLAISQQPAPKKPKMLDPKNLMAPSRLLGALRKGKEGLQTLEGHQQAGKVVALKRLHQDNGDENDFENLITENQIYGNKIVVKEKSQGTVLQERDIGRKNIEDTFDAFSDPNFLYLSNVALQPDNTKNSNFDYGNYCFKKDCPADLDQNIISTESIRFHVKNLDHYQINKDFVNHSSADDIKIEESESKIPFTKTHLLYQVPLIIESDVPPKTVGKFGGKNHFNTELAALLSANVKSAYNDILDSSSNDGLMFTCAIQNAEKNGQHKIIFANMRPNHIQKTDVLSSIDLAEKRRQIKRLKHLSNLHLGKANSSKLNENAWSDDGVLTACGIKREIEKEFFRSKMRDESSQSESDSEGDSIIDVSLSLRPVYLDTGHPKADFLKKFGLVSHKEKSDIEVNLLEKSMETDRIVKACLSIGHMEYVLKTQETNPVQTVNYKLPLPKLKEDFERKEAVTDDKMCFMFGLELNRVSQQHRDDFEAAWRRILSDRKRRRGESTFTKYCEDWHRMYFSEPRQTLDRHARGQLKRMTEIKKSVNDTNNLIKMRLDSLIDCRSCSSSDIPMLAERNFTEITKLSKMANSSIKFIEEKQHLQEDEPNACQVQHGSNGIKKYESYSSINIPNLRKIIALKSMDDFCGMDTSTPISMDEPSGSAALTKFDLSSSDSSTDAMEITAVNTAPKNGICIGSTSTEFSGFLSWPGINAIEECYRRYDTACQSETLALRSENIRLKKEIQKKRIEMSTLNENISQHLAEKKAWEKQSNSVVNLLDKLRVCLELLKGAVV